MGRLREIQGEMLALLEEAKGIVTKKRKTYPMTYERMKAYWHGHIQCALTENHDYVGGDGATMEEAVNEIEGDGGTIDDGITDGAGYVPVTIKASSNFVVQFGYDTNFYCTSRLESCYVQASTIQTVPFLYASEAGATTPTSSTVAIPAMPGRVLYYRLWIGGVAGQVNAIAN
jgi:hypothetical protein